MSDNDKNILITPNTGKAAEPKIEFVGSSSLPIQLNVLDDNSLSFEGSEGQLFVIANNLTSGTIFSVNDVSGIPSLEIDADGTVKIAEFGGNVAVGTNSATHLLTVNGAISASSYVGPIGGGGTLTGNGVANQIPLWTSSTNLSGTTAYYNPTTKHYGWGVASPSASMHISGNIRLGYNNSKSVINADNDSAMSSEANLLLVCDSNGTAGAGTGALIIGHGSAVDTNSNPAQNTFYNMFPNGTPRVEMMRFDANNNRIGLWTSTPEEEVDISASVLIKKDAGAGQHTALTLRQDSTTDQSSSMTCDLDFSLWDNNTRLSTPQARIGVVGSGVASQALEAAGRLVFYTSTEAYPSPVLTERMRIMPDGNVGIGTDTPTGKLHASATSAPALRGSVEEATTNTQRPGLLIERTTTGTAAAGIGVSTYFQIENAGGGLVTGGSHTVELTDVTNPFSDADMYFTVMVNGTAFKERLRLGTAESVFNEDGEDVDFRVESNVDTHSFFVRGSDGNVGFGTTNPASNIELYASQSAAATRMRIENPASNGVADIYLLNDQAGAVFQAVGSSEGATGYPNYARLRSDTGLSGFAILAGAASGKVILGTGDNQDVVITGSYVGVGNTVPLAPLHVSGAAGSDLVNLVDAATINTDASDGNVFKVTLGGNRTLANPTNLVAGFTYMWIVEQDLTGSRTLSYGASFKFPGGTPPTLSTATGSIDVLSAVYDGTSLLCTFQSDFS